MKGGVIVFLKPIVFIITLLTLIGLGCTNKEERARILYNQAIKLDDEGKTEAAINICNQIVENFSSTQTAVEVNKTLKELRNKVRLEKQYKERENEGIKKKIRQPLVNALENFHSDNGRYPTTEEGLRTLVYKPIGFDNWKGPYYEEKYWQGFAPLFEYLSNGESFTLNVNLPGSSQKSDSIGK